MAFNRATMWDVETLLLSLQGSAAIVLRQSRSRHHPASHHGCLMKPGKSLTGGGRCREGRCLVGVWLLVKATSPLVVLPQLSDR